MTMEFMGYLRPDGKVGSRNYVGVIPSVTCANDVAQAICRQVQGTVTFLHHQGCCQMPPDLERVTDTLISLGHSPNLAAILIVSLGCEGTDHERMYDELCKTGKHVEIIHIQELGGVSKAIQAGTDIARRMVIEVSALQRQPVDISNVIMSIKCKHRLLVLNFMLQLKNIFRWYIRRIRYNQIKSTIYIFKHIAFHKCNFVRFIYDLIIIGNCKCLF